MQIEIIETPSLGDRSYLVHDGEVALVVDPQRDIDRVLEVAQRAGVRITDVAETHIHNDYVTGGLALAEKLGATYYVNAEDEVSFERRGIRDGEEFTVGSMTVRAIHTPGHTFTHLSYAVTPADDSDPAVFTGGSLLFGSTGRPDLLGPDHTEALANYQYDSAHRLIEELAEETQIMPTHGFGSFCSATQTEGDSSTIGAEKRQNPVMMQERDQWLAELYDGLTAYPAYYRHMSPANAAGPSAADLSRPERADQDVIAEALAAGHWVVDLRSKKAFAESHVEGTIGIDLEGQFATYLGWLIPWETPVLLLGESGEQVDEAVRELSRIGIQETIQGQATGSPADWADGELQSFPRATFAQLRDARHHKEVTVLDTRRDDEWEAGHLEGAQHFSLLEMGELKVNTPVEGLDAEHEYWVHCAGGFRASVASSLLARAGYRVVAIDDSFDNATDSGLAIVQ
ncbi:MBL fold metallo-hydrolase [Kytococcus sp. Marseille-QA3725]